MNQTLLTKGNGDFGAAIFRELPFQMCTMNKNEFYWMCLVNSFGKRGVLAWMCQGNQPWHQ